MHFLLRESFYYFQYFYFRKVSIASATCTTRTSSTSTVSLASAASTASTTTAAVVAPDERSVDVEVVSYFVILTCDDSRSKLSGLTTRAPYTI